MGIKPRIETAFERALFMSRWLMAPFYAGLVVALAMLLAVFVRELVHYVPLAFTAEYNAGMSNDVILAILTLVDLEGEQDRPPWMGTVDFSGLKMKLIASIVAISGIQLLKSFMNIGRPDPMDENAMMWAVVIHLAFVTSGVMLAIMDWITARTDKH